jgi:hypothetical protein
MAKSRQKQEYFDVKQDNQRKKKFYGKQRKGIYQVKLLSPDIAFLRK